MTNSTWPQKPPALPDGERGFLEAVVRVYKSRECYEASGEISALPEHRAEARLQLAIATAQDGRMQ